ncbi:MAG: PulJ/GspJ family protein [Planctomycetota bacterium]|jgi:prepilin-type N-terminal cleavage/methylation domain-containing protein
MRDPESGFSLIELRVALVVLALILGVTFQVLGTARDTTVDANAYSRDVRGLDGAVREVKKDVRQCLDLKVHASGDFSMILPEGEIHYRLREGTLTRVGTRESRVVARRVALLDIRRRPDGLLFDVTLGPERRKDAGPARAVIRTSVRPRAWRRAR